MVSFMKFTKKLPNKEGYYYYCSFTEHTPCVLYVSKHEGRFYAQNEEFCFVVEKDDLKKLKDENEEVGLEKVDGYYHGEQLWCYIPCPDLPNGKKTTPDCY